MQREQVAWDRRGRKECTGTLKNLTWRRGQGVDDPIPLTPTRRQEAHTPNSEHFSFNMFFFFSAIENSNSHNTSEMGYVQVKCNREARKYIIEVYHYHTVTI